MRCVLGSRRIDGREILSTTVPPPGPIPAVQRVLPHRAAAGQEPVVKTLFLSLSRTSMGPSSGRTTS